MAKFEKLNICKNERIRKFHDAKTSKKKKKKRKKKISDAWINKLRNESNSKVPRRSES